MLETVEVNPQTPPTASVIWCHGLGADGHDFEPIVPELGLPSDLAVRFVFPHAPMMPVTLNGGFVMRAWYDIKGLESLHDEDEAGIRSSSEAIVELIKHEQSLGIPSQKIILAGFSQGGAIALHAGLRYPKPLAGIIGLSTYCPLRDTLSQEASEANCKIPVFMAHGSLDPIVPINAGRVSKAVLEANGYDVDWHEYPMEHSVCLEEIKAIGQWIGKNIKNKELA